MPAASSDSVPQAVHPVAAPADTPPAPVANAERPLPSWAEIVATVEHTDNGAAAMLRLGRGYLNGVNVTVRVNDTFSKMLLERDSIKAAIASAINLSGDAEGIQPQNVTIVVEKVVANEEDPFASLADYQ